MGQDVVIANCLEHLRTMPDDSIDLCVTSPPYWALRDYGSEPVIWGGSENCTHEWQDHKSTSKYCAVCGAWCGQLGLEPTPSEYISHLVMIFDEIKRILKPTGSCWVNLGDTYANKEVDGIRPKSLCQIPSKFSIAMMDHGWILRNEVIWHKPNAMPSSVKDRFTIDYEKFYFFTKNEKYYFNPIKEPVAQSSINRSKYGFESKKFNVGVNGGGIRCSKMGDRFVNPEGRNCRAVWSISTSGNSNEHYAMFPIELIDKPIKSCCPPMGVVLDPFAGSGTVLEYCFNNNIDAIGIEINPEYEKIINKRSKHGQTHLTELLKVVE